MGMDAGKLMELVWRVRRLSKIEGRMLVISSRNGV